MYIRYPLSLRQLGNPLLTIQGLKRNPRFELRLVLLAFRHR